METSAIEVGEITPLNHEGWNNTMKDWPLVTSNLLPLGSITKHLEILTSSGDNIFKQLNLNSSTNDLQEEMIKKRELKIIKKKIE